MCHVHNEKGKREKKWKAWNSQIRKESECRGKERRLQVLGNIGSRHHQTNGDERRNKKRVSQKNVKTSQNKILLQKSHQKDKNLGNPPSKILGTILKMIKGGTQTNRPEDKNVNDNAQGLMSKRRY